MNLPQSSKQGSTKKKRYKQATKFGGNDRAVTPLFPYILSSNPLLPYFHYFFFVFHYCFCLISVLVSLQNYSSLFVVTPVCLYPRHWLLPLCRRSLLFHWNEGTEESLIITVTVKWEWRKPIILMEQNFMTCINVECSFFFSCFCTV